jgi:beta-lactamase regulating signal transducer with metallopeptidase domain
MIDLVDFLSEIGQMSLWAYWGPLLAWSIIGSLLLAALRFAEGCHPFLHLSLREALLFSLPIGLLIAGAWGGERVAPAAAREAVAVAWDASTAWMGAPPSRAPSSRLAVEPPGPNSSPLAFPGLHFWMGLLTMAAAGLALWRLGRLMRETWALRRFRDALAPVSEATRREIIIPLEGQLGLSPGTVTYGAAPAGTMPVTFGWTHPVVALPNDLLEEEGHRRSGEILRMAVLHELVHVRRRDYLLRWVERVVDALFAASPLTRYLVQSIARYRELACDWEVVKETAAPGAYASMLAGHLVRSGRSAPAALSMARSSSFVKTRIEALHRAAQSTQPSTTPYRTSFSVSVLVLVGISACVFLTACSELTTAVSEANHAQEDAQQELFFRDMGRVNIFSEPVSVFSEPVSVSIGGSVWSRATGRPLSGAQVVYAAGGQTDTTTTNALGRFGFEGLPSDAERVQVTARHEGGKGTYEITLEKTLERRGRERRRAFDDRQRQMVMDSDFRLVPAEVIINGRRIRAPDEPMRSVHRMLGTPTAYLSLRIPRQGRLVMSGAAFEGAKRAVVAQGHTITYAADEVNITVTTRLPVLKDGGTRRLWGRYDAERPFRTDGMSVGSGTHVSSLAVRDHAMQAARSECGAGHAVSEECFFRGQ